MTQPLMECFIRPVRSCLRIAPLSTRRRHNRDYHVVVALSGGVDSSVTAGLLQKNRDPAATSVSGIFMSNWGVYDDDTINCKAETDWEDVQRVARHLNNLPVRRQTFEAEYWTMVFEPYLSEIMEKGHLGNPDVSCNSRIKFGALLDFCLQRYGPDTRLATGHYARVWHRDDSNITIPPVIARKLEEEDVVVNSEWILRWGITATEKPSLLLAAADQTKDQSYFLSSCSGESLRRVIFPLGELYKSDSPDPTVPTVRQLAQQFNLHTANKAESMGICFVGKRRNGFRDFLQNHYLPEPATPIDFVDIDTGEVVSTTAPRKVHVGLYNPGQSARIGGGKVKRFVVGSDLVVLPKSFADSSAGNHRRHSENRIVYVCSGTHHPALYADSLMVRDVNWVAGHIPPPLLASGSWRAQCRIRHLQSLCDCIVVQPSSSDPTLLQVIFDQPIRGISSGQQVAFYGLDGLICFGGGPILSRGASYWEQGRSLPAAIVEQKGSGLPRSTVVEDRDDLTSTTPPERARFVS